MSLLSHMSARWASESPKLFKKITNIGVSCTAAGLAATATPSIPGLHIPAIVGTIGGYMLTAGFVTSVIAKLTCQDPDKIDNSMVKP